MRIEEWKKKISAIAVISPLYGNVCKFHPTCSAYALDAVQMHGAVKGTWLTMKRLVRCHPWSLGGYDPVPATDAQKVQRV